jgi:AGZA family xanthine/uracil permease-like MFS transporter
VPRLAVAWTASWITEAESAPVSWAITGAFSVAFLPVLITIFLMDFLDTIGTLMGVGAAGEMLDAEGRFDGIGRPMMADALASVTAGLAGTTTAGAYIESATGIEEGARTGLAALVTAGCFALSLFVLPLFEPIQTLSFAYGPALVFVGILMLRSIARIDLGDPTELVPAAATILMITFTYNIGNGLTAGLIVYAVMKLATGRARELNGWVGALALLSLLYYVAGVAH